MGLIETLEEQCNMGFTGKVIVMKQENKQFLGSVSLLNGYLIRCQYKGASGKKNLFNILIEDMSDQENLRYIVEPEVIEEEATDFQMTIQQFRNESRDRYERYLKSQRLVPPMNLRLVINGDFVVEGEDLTSSEFDVLKTISDYNKVSEIYQNSKLYQYEVTEALVSLRSKKAIKVLR